MDTTARTFDNYSTADGLPCNDLTGWDACYKGATGEMFFGGFAGATAIRLDNLTESTYVPPIVLTELRLSGERVEPWQPPLIGRSITYADSLVLTSQQNDFTIEFSALSFSSPDTNRYRYRLAGLDMAWHHVGVDRRAASFTTLPSGSYRFEVQAAVSRGPWTSPGAALEIVVLPPWWNTWWFRSAYIGAFGLLLFAGYRYRLRQVAYQYHIRLEERMNERNRIARELHDSLLQGFQGLMFRLQAVRDLLPDAPNRAIADLDVALDRADQAIIEGRDAVRDLRAPALTDTDLGQALTSLADELGHPTSARRPALKVLVEGVPRTLAASIRNGAYLIAREGLRNAFRHSRAANVECDLRYGEKDFRIRVRDDGLGIHPTVLEAGTVAGHWGLPGMRERAEQLGGTLTVWSARDAGTELELCFPARIAYNG